MVLELKDFADKHTLEQDKEGNYVLYKTLYAWKKPYTPPLVLCGVELEGNYPEDFGGLVSDDGNGVRCKDKSCRADNCEVMHVGTLDWVVLDNLFIPTHHVVVGCSIPNSARAFMSEDHSRSLYVSMMRTDKHPLKLEAMVDVASSDPTASYNLLEAHIWSEKEKKLAHGFDLGTLCEESVQKLIKGLSAKPVGVNLCHNMLRYGSELFTEEQRELLKHGVEKFEKNHAKPINNCGSY